MEQMLQIVHAYLWYVPVLNPYMRAHTLVLEAITDVDVNFAFCIGWWMVLCDDGNQGYAPASLLESVEGGLHSDDEELGEKDLLSGM